MERERNMQIVMKSRQTRVSPHLREKIERKIQHLERWVSEGTRAKVTVTEEQTRSANDRFSVQIVLSGNSSPIRSEVSALNIPTALDLAIDKIVAQLTRHKGRLTTKRHHVTSIKDLEMPSLNEEPSVSTEAEELERSEEGSWSRVLEIRRLPTQMMTDQEVIAQMEKSGNPLYPFVNPETHSVNVMYRLDNGGYGLLVPAQE
jgi:putative sigma-54 modulation protein